MDQDKFMSFGQWDEMSAKDHYRKVMRGGRGKGFVVSTPIDRDRYPNREKQGLEGPYKSRKSGKIFYYDKKAGKYYDPDSDMYLDVSDVMEELAESRGQQKAMDAAVKRGRKSDSNGTMVITAGKDGKGRVFYATSIDRVHGDILKVGTDKSKAVKLTKGNAAKLVRGKATFVKAVNIDDEISSTKKISDAELKKLVGEENDEYDPRLGEMNIGEATNTRVVVDVNRAGYRKLESMIASLDGYRESEFDAKQERATFHFDANKHDNAERKKVAGFIKKTRGADFHHSMTEDVELDEAWTGETVLRNAEIGSKSGYGINIKKRGAVTKTPYKHMLMTKSTGKKIKVRFDHGKKEFVGTAEEVADYLNKILGISEDAAVNNIGDGNVKGFDPVMGKNPRKRKKFAGCEVFEVTPETYRKCMWGKKKFEHWKRYIDLDNDEENTIREFALRNPRAGIILQNSSTGEMVYLRHKR